MPERSEKKPRDTNALAAEILREATSEIRTPAPREKPGEGRGGGDSRAHAGRQKLTPSLGEKSEAREDRL